MDLASLLAPFLPQPLAALQVTQLELYLDLLVKWNARTNLTAVRDPQYIVSRHFGESLFAAARLLPAASAIDVGSGAGFPGLPLKIYAPSLALTLIEAHNKKATFLREVVRTLQLEGVEVFAGRAETFPRSAALVTMRAVEKFDASLALAARLVAPAGRLALLIGAAQVPRAQQLVPHFSWQPTVPIPQSEARVLLVGTNQAQHESSK